MTLPEEKKPRRLWILAASAMIIGCALLWMLSLRAKSYLAKRIERRGSVAAAVQSSPAHSSPISVRGKELSRPVKTDIFAEQLLKRALVKRGNQPLVRWTTVTKSKKGSVMTVVQTELHDGVANISRSDVTVEARGRTMKYAMTVSPDGVFLTNENEVVMLPRSVWDEDNAQGMSQVMNVVSSDSVSNLIGTDKTRPKSLYSIESDLADPNLMLVGAYRDYGDSDALANSISAELSSSGSGMDKASLLVKMDEKSFNFYLIDPRTEDIQKQYSYGGKPGTVRWTPSVGQRIG